MTLSLADCGGYPADHCYIHEAICGICRSFNEIIATRPLPIASWAAALTSASSPSAKLTEPMDRFANV
jgi:hypothetical protein